jgi:heterodisulfide reductase subunit B
MTAGSYLYYPGCSQKATARGYEESLLAVASTLGIELKEIPDWNCCGATAVIAVNKVLSQALAARNLALAEPLGQTVVTPCPSCSLCLNKANHVLEEGGPLAEKVTSALEAGGLSYRGKVRVRHLLDVLINDVGTEEIKSKVKSPLAGVRIAPYYGCQIVRPMCEGDSADAPQNLEQLIGAVGGEPASFPLATACCGGALAVTRADVGQKMCTDILRSIKAAEAQLVVTPCSLCQVTLDMAQTRSKKLLGERMRLPIVTPSQLIGLALGLTPKQLGLNRLLTPKKCLRALAKGDTQAA